MAAPETSDVVDFLVNRCGVDADSLLVTHTATLENMLNAALQDLERVTGYSPFITAAASDGYVEINGKRGLFWNGANGALTVSLDGTIYTEGTDYLLYPLNQARKEWMKWLRVCAPGKPLTVNAEWGFADDYPADLWEAVVMLAAGMAIASYSAGQAGFAGESWTDGDVSVKQATAAHSSGETGLSSLSPGALISEAKASMLEHSRKNLYWGN